MSKAVSAAVAVAYREQLETCWDIKFKGANLDRSAVYLPAKSQRLRVANAGVPRRSSAAIRWTSGAEKQSQTRRRRNRRRCEVRNRRWADHYRYVRVLELPEKRGSGETWRGVERLGEAWRDVERRGEVNHLNARSSVFESLLDVDKKSQKYVSLVDEVFRK